MRPATTSDGQASGPRRRGSSTTGVPMTAQTRERRIQIPAERGKVCRGCRRQGPDDEVAPDEHVGPGTHQLSQSALHPIAHHGTPHRTGDHEARPQPSNPGDFRSRGDVESCEDVARRGRRRHARPQMDDERLAPAPAPAADHGGEVARRTQPSRGRKHVRAARKVRQTALRGPYGDAQRGWHARRGCACAAGSRGSWPDVGCSAGKCACSLGNSTLVGSHRMLEPHNDTVRERSAALT
jgi:hypothetical protein